MRNDANSFHLEGTTGRLSLLSVNDPRLMATANDSDDVTTELLNKKLTTGE
jgi:hypothetical protein